MVWSQTFGVPSARKLNFSVIKQQPTAAWASSQRAAKHTHYFLPAKRSSIEKWPVFKNLLREKKSYNYQAKGNQQYNGTKKCLCFFSSSNQPFGDPWTQENVCNSEALLSPGTRCVFGTQFHLFPLSLWGKIWAKWRYTEGYKFLSNYNYTCTPWLLRAGRNTWNTGTAWRKEVFAKLFLSLSLIKELLFEGFQVLCRSASQNIALCKQKLCKTIID